MNKLLLIPFCLLFTLFAQGQALEFVVELDNDIDETSGLVYVEGRLVTFNDSGGSTRLYEIDTLSGNVERTVFVSNTSNTDWEDIEVDDTYIYIGDFGNNDGTRMDLKVYRILKSSFLTSNFVSAEAINFSYVDQTDFTSNQQTNFDAEALMAYEDNLYVFTKNRGDFRTNVYELPKEPGSYSVNRVDSMAVQGLITAATYDEAADAILLTGYTFFNAFVVDIRNFEGTAFSEGDISKHNLTIPGSFQVEAITSIGTNQYYISNEKNDTGDAAVYRLNNSILLSAQEVNKSDITIYPNPATNILNIQGDGFAHFEVKNIFGQTFITSDDSVIDIQSLTPGYYVLQGFTKNNRVVSSNFVKL